MQSWHTGLGEEVQRDKPRARSSNCCTEQHSPASPIRNIGMVHNFGFLQPCLKPIPDVCPSAHRAELLRAAASLGGSTAQSFPLAPSPLQSPLAGLGPGAGTPWSSARSATTRAGLQPLGHSRELHIFTEGAGGSLGLTGTQHLAWEASTARG